MFILLLDGPITQPPRKSIDPSEAEAAAQGGATEDCSCFFGTVVKCPYFTSCFEKQSYFVVLLGGDFYK